MLYCIHLMGSGVLTVSTHILIVPAALESTMFMVFMFDVPCQKQIITL